jgi:hypothetical protein
MWGFQSDFRINQEMHAKAVFQLLDEHFEPEVFLVGVLDEHRTDRYPACVEPDVGFWIPSASFDQVMETAAALPASYPESQMGHSHPRMQENEARRLRRRAIHETICKIIADCPAKPVHMTYFASLPVARDGYLISAVLGLQTDIVRSHARLRIDRAWIHEYRSFKATVSLIDAAVDEFLRDAASELGRPDAGEALGSARSPAELIRNAGSRFTMHCVYKCDRDFDLAGAWGQFFDDCNSLAALKYEQVAGSGRLVVARRQHDSLQPVITFVNPVALRNARGARKLLELSSRGIALHVNARFIFGLVEVRECLPEKEDLFVVRVLGHYHWQLAHNGQTLMEVRSGQPRLPVPLFNAAKLRTDLPRIFPRVSADDADRLVKLVESASTEKHGTMLVVLDDAATEASRLASQATVIQPCLMTPELINHITPIDGAVLMSPDGMCHAIGVILDGLATSQGNSARGARYNSAIRFVQGHPKPCLAVVVSEDGGVDLIPDLPSAVHSGSPGGDGSIRS